MIIIQDETVNNTANYFFSHRAGWIIAFVVCGVYAAERPGRRDLRTAGTASRCATRSFFAAKVVIVLAVADRHSSSSATRTAASRSS